MAHASQERYSALVDAKLRATLVTRDNTIFNNRYEGSPKAGKVKIPVRDTEVAVKAYDKANGVDALLKSLKSVDPFPVGSIYQSTARTSPAALFGGTWQEIAQNRVLMGAGSGHAAGTTVEAGLPNITGSFVADVKKGEHKVSGAFTAGSVIASTGEYNSFSDVYKFSLDASKSNAIYGRSATVQPAAYYVHIWRRVA